jgi:5-methylcytosine-specific restriction endonuclease McrA
MSRTIEHLTPITRGGRHDLDNIDFAHYGCNSSKGARTTEEHMERRKLAS